MNKIKFKIKEVKPKIFLAEFEDSYDMCMTFCRYQEFYESPNSQFRNHNFKLFDFIKWYSNHYSKGNFTYATDWSGFNVPSKVLLKCWLGTAQDYTCYDSVMTSIIDSIHDKLLKKYGTINIDFYLIGAQKGRSNTVKHEVAHGMFYLNKNYKKEMLSLVKALKPKFRNQFYKDLQKVGYSKQVLPDEAQAFLATGWRNYFTKLNGEAAPFIEVFNKYYEKQ